MTEALPYVGMDDPIPLKRAVEIFFPHGGLTVATLQAAIRSGALGHEKEGRAYFVTEADIKAWRASCRKKPRARASTSESGEADKLSGSSKTDRQKSAQAAAEQIASELRKGSLNIFRSGSSLTPENVTLIASRLPKS